MIVIKCILPPLTFNRQKFLTNLFSFINISFPHFYYYPKSEKLKAQKCKKK